MQPVARRIQIELEQEKIMAPYACSVKQSKGRMHKEEADEYRTDFQRDRDRVIHTRAFRRLQGKTQVFFAGEGDHYRNRLTHTLEVQQIARDIARALGLNEDLAETVALAHDLGHTPFAHAGQEQLDAIMRKFGKSFEHNVQSRRIVEFLESPYPNFIGLNLTIEVLDGLAKHTPTYNAKGEVQKINSLEGETVDLADEIAYHHHDLDDGFRSGLLTWKKALQDVYLLRESYEIILKKYGPSLSPDQLIRRVLKRMVDMMVKDVVLEAQKRLRKLNVKTFSDVLKLKDKVVVFSDDMISKTRQLRRYLHDTLYYSSYVREQGEEGKKIITYLFEYYLAHLTDLPADDQQRIADGESAEEVVKDYVAGMTDLFAIGQYRKFFPKQKIKAIQLALIGE